LVPKLRILSDLRVAWDGRGAFCQLRRSTVRTAGADGSANVGMSSEMWVRIPHAVSLRFPEEGLSAQG
jgi:hypothetical protein